MSVDGDGMIRGSHRLPAWWDSTAGGDGSRTIARVDNRAYARSKSCPHAGGRSSQAFHTCYHGRLVPPQAFASPPPPSDTRSSRPRIS